MVFSPKRMLEWLSGQGDVRWYFPDGIYLSKEQVVLGRDLSVRRSFILRGEDESSFGTAQKEEKRERLSKLLMSLSRSTFSTVVHNTYRFRPSTTPPPKKTYSPDTPLACKIVEDEAFNVLCDSTLETDIIHTISLQPQSFPSKKRKPELIQKAVKELAIYSESLSSVYPGHVMLPRYELLETYASYLSGEAMPGKGLLLSQGLHIPSIITHSDSLQIGNTYIGIVSLRSVEAHSEHLLRALRDLQIPFEYVNRFKAPSLQEQERLIESLYQKSLIDRLKFSDLIRVFSKEKTVAEITENEDNLSLNEQKRLAIDSLREGESTFCLSKSFIVVKADSEEALATNIARIVGTTKSCGVVAKEETLFTQPLFLSGLHGSRLFPQRDLLLSSDDLKYLLPTSSTWCGSTSDRTFSSPLFSARGIGGCRIDVTAHSTVPGLPPHIGIFGASGSGKSTLILRIASAAMAYPNAKVRIIDNGYSARTFTRLCKGTHFDPGQSAIGIDPICALSEEDNNFEFIEDIVLQIFRDARQLDSSIQIGSDLQGQLHSALKSLLRSGSIRSMESLCHQIPHPWRKVLDTFTKKYTAHLAQGLTRPGEQKIATIELKNFLSTDSSTYGMSIWKMIIFQMLYPLDGRHTFLIIDEASRLLSNSLYGEQIEGFFATLRKYNVTCILSVQSPSQIFHQPYGREILSHLGTLLCLKNPYAKTSEANHYSELGLNETQREWVAGNFPKIRDQGITSHPVVVFRNEGCQVVDLCLGPLSRSFFDTNIFSGLTAQEPDKALFSLLEAHGETTMMMRYLHGA